MLEIDLNGKTAFSPGERIDVEVRWDLAATPLSAELRVVWNTSGKGDRDLEVVETISVEAGRMADRQRLSVTLPEEPYSFSGKLLSINWALEMIVFPTKESTRQPITIAPEGREVVMEFNDESA